MSRLFIIILLVLINYSFSSLGQQVEFDFNNQNELFSNTEIISHLSTKNNLMKKKASFNNNYRISQLDSWEWKWDVWVVSARSFYNYNEHNFISEILNEKWENNSWVNSNRTIYNYDANNLLSNSQFQNYNLGNWENISRWVIEYNENDDKIEERNESWEVTKWVNKHRSLFGYDDDMNEIYVQHQIWQNDSWEDSYRFINTYDDDNQVIETLQHFWDGSAWVNAAKQIPTYDAKNRTSEIIILNWKSNQWENRFKYDFVYGISDSLETISIQIWNTDHWENSTRTTTEWNQELKIRSLDQIWDNNSWVNRSDETWDYDYNDNILEHVYRQWENYDWLNYYREQIFWEPITQIDKSIINYKSFTLHQNYPNPFNPITKIKYSIPKQSNVTLKVFDVLGIEVKTLVNKEQRQGNYEIEFDRSELTSGIYFYRLQVYHATGGAGDFVETKKMILLK